MNLDEQISYIESVRHENRSGEAHSILASLRELKRLREALKFYAEREHLSGPMWDEWDFADHEHANWLCPPSDDAGMAEDGGMARAALKEADDGQ